MKIGRNSWISPKASIYGSDYITIGDNVRIDDFCILSGGSEKGSGINIGNHIHIAAGTKLYGGGGITIKDFAQISSNIIIYSQSDDFFGESMVGPCIPMKFKPNLIYSKVVINQHVLIGAGVIILPGVIIGEGASIGAMSLVKNNCVPWKVYKGIPAKIHGDRSKNMLSLAEKFLSEYNNG